MNGGGKIILLLVLCIYPIYWLALRQQSITDGAASMLDPRTFPRPPALQRLTKHVLIKWPGASGATIAESRNAYWVLETYHPPTYYIPRTDVQADLQPTSRSTYCEWKGAAKYWSIKDPGSGKNVDNRCWSYEKPTSGFADIKGYLSFYSEPWECYVDGEKGIHVPLQTLLLQQLKCSQWSPSQETSMEDG